MSTTAAPTASTQPAPPPPTPDAAPAPPVASSPPAPAAFVWLHEEEGGDGRIHVVPTGAPADTACPCGTALPATAARIAPDDQQLGFRPPEMFCDAARAALAPKPAQTPAQTQAIAQQAQKEAVPFQPRDTAEMFRYASFLARSHLIPRSLQGSPSDILVVLLKGQDLGLTPMQSIAGINVIDGKAEVGALTMVALVRKSGLCEMWQLVSSDTKRAVYRTKRRGDLEPTEFEYTIEEAEAAGLTKKGGTPDKVARSPWNTQRRTMLRRRCQSMLAREVYPDIVGGLYDHEELSEMRDLEVELIKTGMKAAAAGFQPDPAFEPPAWMGGPTLDPPIAPPVASSPPVAEVIELPPRTAAPPPPADPLKARLAKKVAAAKPAAPPPDTQPAPPPADVMCTGCGVPIDPPAKGAPQMCYACQNS